MAVATTTDRNLLQHSENDRQAARMTMNMTMTITMAMAMAMAVVMAMATLRRFIHPSTVAPRWSLSGTYISCVCDSVCSVCSAGSMGWVTRLSRLHRTVPGRGIVKVGIHVGGRADSHSSRGHPARKSRQVCRWPDIYRVPVYTACETRFGGYKYSGE